MLPATPPVGSEHAKSTREEAATHTLTVVSLMTAQGEFEAGCNESPPSFGSWTRSSGTAAGVRGASEDSAESHKRSESGHTGSRARFLWALVFTEVPTVNPFTGTVVTFVRIVSADDDAEMEQENRSISPTFLFLQIVQEYERAVIFRLGRVNRSGAKGPGIFWILPCTDNFCRVDLRTVSFAVPPQEVLTKDSVTILVDAVVFYRIFNPTIAVTKVDNANQATQLLAQTTLRNMLGTKNLTEILVDREEMAEMMGHSLYNATKEWGIKVERVEIKDVKLPDSLQRAMAAEAEAARDARAKVIAAEGEMNASRALKEAALVMSESPAALQLRYLQTLSHIAAENNSTVVFPIPIDLLSVVTNK
ncbi:stomatin-like [Ambystoma mexicanum]|uniref:stomatin-like n=1 Tax=Ambystoma mexicanum TaxID=8296 RepID=UPI0037E7CAB4